MLRVSPERANTNLLPANAKFASIPAPATEHLPAPARTESPAAPAPLCPAVRLPPSSPAPLTKARRFPQPPHSPDALLATEVATAIQQRSPAQMPHARKKQGIAWPPAPPAPHSLPPPALQLIP